MVPPTSPGLSGRGCTRASSRCCCTGRTRAPPTGTVQSLRHVRLCDLVNPSTPGLPVQPTPRVYSNPRPSSRWCHPAISSSVVPFSSCPQSLPASGSFPVSQLFAWGDRTTLARLPYCLHPPLCPSSVGLGQAGRGYGMLLPEQAGLCSLASLPSCVSPQVRILHISSYFSVCFRNLHTVLHSGC